MPSDKYRVWLIEESETTGRNCPPIHTPLGIIIRIKVVYVVCISLLHYQRSCRFEVWCLTLPSSIATTSMRRTICDRSFGVEGLQRPRTYHKNLLAEGCRPISIQFFSEAVETYELTSGRLCGTICAASQTNEETSLVSMQAPSRISNSSLNPA
jgi:hypothetical protein